MVQAGTVRIHGSQSQCSIRFGQKASEFQKVVIGCVAQCRLGRYESHNASFPSANKKRIAGGSDWLKGHFAFTAVSGRICF